VVEICQLAEGVPLAIELSSAWVKSLSVAEIAAGMKEDRDFLVSSLRDIPERHRSLRAVFDYSWRLISAQEKLAFQAISVFRGGFSAEAATKVTEGSIRLLAALVEKSLVRKNNVGRYEVHEFLRQYAEEKLNQDVEQRDQARQLHARYYADRLRALYGCKFRPFLEAMNADVENIRHAWQWALENGKKSELGDLAGSFWDLHRFRTLHVEGYEAFSRALRSVEGTIAGPEDEVLLAKLLTYKGYFCPTNAESIECCERALALFRKHGAQREMVPALVYLGKIAPEPNGTTMIREGNRKKIWGFGMDSMFHRELGPKLVQQQPPCRSRRSSARRHPHCRRNREPLGVK
jgi:hypothetical protein